MTESAMSVSEMIERLRLLPSSARQFQCDMSYAKRRFGIGTDTLNDLIARGLPHKDVDGELRVEYGDLHYLGLQLGTARMDIWALLSRTESLERFAREHRTDVSITDVPQTRSRPGPVDGVLRAADDPDGRASSRSGRCIAETRGTLIGQWPELPSAAGRIVCDVADSVSFYVLPEPVHGDTQLARRIGLADCVSGAALLTEELQAAGFETRVTDGLLVGFPYSTNHSWAEVRVGRTWTPIDPLMIRLLSRFGRLDEATWPPDRSTGPMLLPLTSLQPRVVLTSNDLDITLVTSLCGGGEPLT